MQYPHIKVLSGIDVNDIVATLVATDISYSIIPEVIKVGNVDYTIKHTDVNKKTTLFIDKFNWINKSDIYLKDIKDGLQLSFFKPSGIKLSWDPEMYIPNNYDKKLWDIINIDTDAEYWLKHNSENDRSMLAVIINECILYETEIWKMYEDCLISTFLHYDISRMLSRCARHKEEHIDMWYEIQEKFDLDDVNDVNDIDAINKSGKPAINKSRKPATTFQQVVNDLTELIEAEGVLEPAATKCLTYFSNKGYLSKFMKFVKLRDEESRNHSEIVKVLLDNIKIIYPFLSTTIVKSIKKSKFYSESQSDNLFFELPALEKFSNAYPW